MTKGVGTYQLNAFWESGNLIYYEKQVGHTDTGDVLTIGTAAVKVGGTAQAVDFSWYATGGLSFVLSASDSSMTLLGLNVAIDGDIVIGTDDIAVAQGYYVYLSGLAGGEYVRSASANYIIVNGTTGVDLGIAGTAEVSLIADSLSPSTSDGCALGTTSKMWSDLFLASAGVINFSNGDITLTHSANMLTLAGGGLTITDNTIYLGANRIVMDFNSADLILYHFDGQLYLSGGNFTMATTGRLELRDGNSRIWSPDAGKLAIYCSSSASDAITIQAGGSYGTLQLVNCYLKLLIEDVDGDGEAEMWYDNSEKHIKFYNGSSVVTVMDTTGGTFTVEPTFADGLQVSYTKKIELGDSEAFIQAGSSGDVGHLLIRANSTTSDAVTITVPSPGGIWLNGILKLDTGAGSEEGQFWYNTSLNKLQFYNGSAIETVTSAV